MLPGIIIFLHHFSLFLMVYLLKGYFDGFISSDVDIVTVCNVYVTTICFALLTYHRLIEILPQIPPYQDGRVVSGFFGLHSHGANPVIRLP